MTDSPCTRRFGFNAYSYESDWAVGMELWNRRKPKAAAPLAEEPSEFSVVVPASKAIVNDANPGISQTTKEAAEAVTSSAGPSRARIRERSFQAKLEWRLDDKESEPETENDMETVAGKEIPEGPTGVLKCRCDQRMRIGLLYEGRYKSLLFSLGTDINLKKLDAPFRTVGLAVQFSS